jgi:FkbM family methyltransferase
MKFYQRILIEAHSRVDRLGWLNSGVGLVIYSKLYFAYKRQLEGRELLSHVKYLTKSDSGFARTSLVIDVGAHIGFFTREALKLFPGARVIAIEPPGRNSINFKILNAEIVSSEFVQFHNVAAWSFDGQIPFHFEDSNTANNRFDSSSITRVPCITVDSLTSQKPPSILILKIDVQGFEFEVLEGTIETLKSHQVALLIELDEGALQARGKSSAELCLKLRDLGFYAKNIKNGEEITPEQIQSMLQKRDCLDFLFVSKIK